MARNFLFVLIKTSKMELKRVVVTGLGALTPIGNSVQEYWEGLTNGVSGAAPLPILMLKF